MAITATVNYNIANVTLPSGYPNPTLPTITAQASGSFAYDMPESGVADANPVTGATQMAAALKTYFEGTYAINNLSLDATDTITAALTIQRFERINDGDDSSKFETGTVVYRMRVKYSYE